MKTQFIKSGLAVLAAASILGGCQMVDGDADNDDSTRMLAVLVDDKSETVDALKAALAKAIERGQVEIGPADLTSSSMVSVLPPPLHPSETHSTAMPIIFNLMVGQDGACHAVRKDNGESYPLTGLTCRAIE